jgi:serine phosphatase RsbU (regulator of sigma subunit)/anti-sigma regulatory factor (Ser/Thr protein kinase)
VKLHGAGLEISECDMVLSLRRNRVGQAVREQSRPDPLSAPRPGPDELPPFDLPAHDPLHAYLLGQAMPVDLTKLRLESPALAALRAAGVVLVMPLISSGSLIGLLNLGPRRSERGYNAEDRRLLSALAGYAAPAMRVGQLVRQQQAEARDRERIEHELKVAQLIQQQFLPKEVPDLPSWQVAAFYRPARTVGGDFYDFIALPDGRVMFVVGDVTDKGVPAALVMASTHALLRDAAPRLVSPGSVLAHVNDLLCADIPAHMFVTCLALVLDPASGHLDFANAGHDVPYVRTCDGVAELRARGMPLGLMPGAEYEEKTFEMRPGDCALLHSDGLAEAHGPDREMFGFPRVADLVGRAESGEKLIDSCLTELAAFTGADHEQEDDITLVTLRRSGFAGYSGRQQMASVDHGTGRRLVAFTVSSEPGNERLALDRVATAVAGTGLEASRLDRLKTAVAEATMNAIEHGNRNRADLPVEIEVTADAAGIVVTITDQEGAAADATADGEAPDLGLKLAGEQSPRGWGLFLIRHMVDGMDVTTEGARRTVRLTMATDVEPTRTRDGEEGAGSEDDV